MSSESNDGEQISDWTLVSESGDDEIKLGESAEDKLQNNNQDNDSKDEVTSVVDDKMTDISQKKSESFQLESKIDEISAEELGLPPSLKVPELLSKEGSDSSDIERISDDGIDNYPMDGSVISQTSSFSLISRKDCIEGDNESLASSSSISVIRDDDSVDFSSPTSSKYELPIVLDNERVRSYTHKPNRKLNVALSLLLTLSVTMVFGLGIGHFIGWSSRWTHDYQLQQTHIIKLKALQEELVNCLQNPQTNYMQENGEIKECYEKVDYWQKRFEDILSENHGLQELIDKSADAQDDDEEDDDEKCEEATKNIVSEYRKLKFHLIKQQLENVATLRKMEALKRQEMATLDRVKKLEEENEELKAQVEEESESNIVENDDVDKELIRQLTDENHELRQELGDLMTILELEKEEEDNKITEEIGSLREQINQLKTENSELQQVIAKLRYGQPPKDASYTGRREKESTENDFVIRTWITDHLEGLNLTGFMDYLTKVAMDKTMARKELQQLQDNLKSSYEKLSEKAKVGINTGKNILSEIQTNLQSKLEQIMNAETFNSALPMETIRKVGNVVKTTVEKMHEIGGEMLSSQSTTSKPSTASAENRVNKLKKQMDKVFKSFTKQLDNIKSKVWGSGGGGGDDGHVDSGSGSSGGEEKVLKEEQIKLSSDNHDRDDDDPKRDSKRYKEFSRNKEQRKKKREGQGDHERYNNDDHSKKDKKKLKKFHDSTTDEDNSVEKLSSSQFKRDIKIPLMNNNNNNLKNSFSKNKDKEISSDKLRTKKMKQKKHKKENGGGNYNETAAAAATSSDWQFKRSVDRNDQRRSRQQSDWTFDRAKDRDQRRKEARRSDWYFERSNKNSYRDVVPEWNDDDDDDDDYDGDDDMEKYNIKNGQEQQEYWEKVQNYDHHHHHDGDDDDWQKRWKKSKKYKYRKNRKVYQDSDDDEEEDDDDDSDYEATSPKNKKQKYYYYHHQRHNNHYHKYWFKWAIPHSKSYVSS